MTTRRVAVAVAALLVLLAGAAAGAALLASPRGAATAPLRPSSTPSPVPVVSADLAGTWVVDPGSVVGYRVRERFAGQSADAEAVARTTAVSGQLSMVASNAGLQLTAASFSADLRQLKSEDANATHGNAVRDTFVGRIYLETAVYPMATFQAQLGPLQATALPATLTLPGTFTAHGVTRGLAVTLQVARSGDRLEATGSFPLHYGDYHVEVPSVPFTTAAPDTTIEVHLFLKRLA